MARCHTTNNEPPKARHYKACSTHLIHDLHHLATTHPTIHVLTLGAPATTQLHKLYGRPNVSLKSSFNTQGLTLTHPQLPTITTWSTFHPAAILREWKLMHAVAGHLTLLTRALEGSLPTPSTPHIIPTRGPITHGTPPC